MTEYKHQRQRWLPFCLRCGLVGLENTMRTLASLSLLAFSTVALADPPTWTQWRGPNRDGHVAGATPWPEKLDSNSLRVLWRAENLGESYSGPIVGPDRVFVTGTEDKKTELIRALDRKTGKLVWKVEWEGAISVPFFAARNGSWIRATPALDGDTLYVAGIRDVLVALDEATGKERWRADFPKLLGTSLPSFGFVSSPLVVGEALFVQAGASLVKLDKRTGKLLWQSLKEEGGMMASAFASPVLARIAGTEQLVVQTRTRLVGVEPVAGKVLWSREIPSFRGMNILTPLPFSDGVFTSTYGGNTQWFPIASEGGTLTPGKGWSLKYEGHMTSPVVVRNHAYLLGRDQRFLCVDLETGKERWRTEKRFGQYWSLVVNGDRLLALDQKGRLYLLKANPEEFDLLGEHKVADGETWAHLAVCGDEIYIRDLKGLTVYRWK